jgi:hypothetical protein
MCVTGKVSLYESSTLVTNPELSEDDGTLVTMGDDAGEDDSAAFGL